MKKCVQRLYSVECWVFSLQLICQASQPAHSHSLWRLPGENKTKIFLKREHFIVRKCILHWRVEWSRPSSAERLGRPWVSWTMTGAGRAMWDTRLCWTIIRWLSSTYNLWTPTSLNIMSPSSLSVPEFWSLTWSSLPPPSPSSSSRKSRMRLSTGWEIFWVLLTAW